MKYICHECAVPCHLSFKIEEDYVNYPPKYCPCGGEQVNWIKEEEE